MRKILIILGLIAFFLMSKQAYAQIIPEKINKKVSENYKLINEIVEEAFKNVPIISESVKKNVFDPNLYLVENFYKKIKLGDYKYEQKYDFVGNQTIKLSENYYFIEAPKEKFKYSKEGKLLSYSLFKNKDIFSLEYYFLPENWKLDTVKINVEGTHVYSFDSNGKFLHEPDFGPYMNKLQKKIKSNVNLDRFSLNKRIVIFFRLDKEGNLLKSRIKESSGNPIADRTALNAIKDSAPFGRLPADYREDSLDIEFNFDFNVYNLAK